MIGADKRLMKFAKRRDKAFTAFVMNDDWDAVLKHLHHYRMDFPQDINEEVKKAAVLKGVQECTNISEEVKAKAAEKCIAMGFEPTMF